MNEREEIRENPTEMRVRKRLLFFGLPFTFTVYSVSETLLTVTRGFLNKTEDDCYLYKVQDVRLTQSFIERIFGLGTVICYTGDATDKIITLEHIPDSREMKNHLLQVSEAARMKRRTVNMQDISAESDEDMD